MTALDYRHRLRSSPQASLRENLLRSRKDARITARGGTRAGPIARQLYQLRLLRGTGRDEIALRIGVATDTLGNWERGETGPTLPMLEAWCGALGLTLALVRQDAQ